MRSFVYITFVSALVSCVYALPRPTRSYGRDADLPATNAERLGRSLPLKAPVRRSAAVGTRTSASASSSPSPSASSSVRAGYVAVFDGDSRIGYLQCKETCQVIPNEESYYATAVQFSPDSQGKPFDITYSGGSNPNMGGLVGAFSGDLAPGSAAEARIQSVGTTNPGVIPFTSHAEFTESAIWSYNKSNGLLTPTWTNSLNDDITTFIMADANGDLFLSGDAAEFESKHGSQSAGPLTFHFNAASYAARARSSY
ncbi:hypothetical protein CALCODRAFT_491890 [Calocera cornea HHB12733]|uniref:Acid protease n=1 Tax=Calocera cornea HHB12733 TaxID=1353952 RepID=A0A165IT71_9BASI|nr:hypothetical protein CALCODRAFT_491890 [Calocera cornea HHB12733]